MYYRWCAGLGRTADVLLYKRVEHLPSYLLVVRVRLCVAEMGTYVSHACVDMSKSVLVSVRVIGKNFTCRVDVFTLCIPYTGVFMCSCIFQR